MSGDTFAALLRSMLGPREPQPGPPYTHVHALPPPVLELGEDGEEVEVCQPLPPTFSVERGPRGRLHELAPIEPSAAFRRLTAEMLTATVGIGCYWPLTDP